MKKKLMAVLMSLCVASGLFYTGGISVGAEGGDSTSSSENEIKYEEDSDANNFAFGTIKGKNTEYSIVGYTGKLESISLPSSNISKKGTTKITQILAGAFAENTATKNIKIPETVTQVDSGILDDNYTIENIDVDEKNAAYTSDNGILYNNDKDNKELVKCPNTRTYVKVPDGVKTIGRFAFSDNAREKERDNNSQSEYCKLEKISIPKSVEKIEEGAFSGCFDLQYVYYEGTEEDWKNINIVTDSKGYNDPVVLVAQKRYEQYEPAEKTDPADATATPASQPAASPTDNAGTASPTREPAGDVTAASPEPTTAPASDQSIGVSTDQAINIISPTDKPVYSLSTPPVPTAVPGVYATFSPAPSAVPTVGDYDKCVGTRLKYSAKITDNGKLIATVTGVNSKNVKSIVIPSSITINNYEYKVTGIADKAFQNCKKLKKVIIGKNVKKIGKSAFKNCKKLNSVAVLSKNITSVGANSFKGIASKATILLPKKKFAAIKKKFGKAGLPKKVKYKKIVVL
jgi:hypothetical protein